MGHHGSKVLSSRCIFRRGRALCLSTGKSQGHGGAPQENPQGAYTFDVQGVRDNFSEWKNTEIVVGSISETLAAIKSEQIAFLHLDLNCSLPEDATLEALWGSADAGSFRATRRLRLYRVCAQKLGIDAFARSRNISVLSLPTGQGLIMKLPSDPPPRRAAASGFNTNCVRRLTTRVSSSVVKPRGNRCHPDLCELREKVGDGVNQAADLISATASIPSLNFIPLTTFGN
jgi:hypothetical protein